MMNSVWLLEYRTRKRKNGKWSEWASRDRTDSTAQAYHVFPDVLVFANEKYERRAVEYVRATLPSNAVPAQASTLPSALVPALHKPPTT